MKWKALKCLVGFLNMSNYGNAKIYNIAMLLYSGKAKEARDLFTYIDGSKLVFIDKALRHLYSF